MRPWHFWPVALVALLWSLAASTDHLLTVLRVPAYLGLFSDDLVAYITDLSSTLIAIWGVGVWAGFGGVLMMCWNARGSAMVLALAAAGSTCLAVWLIVLAEPPLRHVAGIAGDAIMMISAVVPILIWLYARALHSRGVLN
ncbi:MAG: hypothetical protein AAGK37_09830 [Pseudomonadota bacterium]